MRRNLSFRRSPKRIFSALAIGLLVQCWGIDSLQAQEQADSTPTENQEFEDEFFPEEEEELEFGAVAEVEAPPRESTKRTIGEEQLTRIPGTRGDALRAVEVMPGVSRTPMFSNDGAPLLRGSSSLESAVMLDGAEVPLIYHFGGLTSFFNSHLLESVNLYPGNYSARYGRAAAGIVEARVRDPKQDKFHALLELSAIDSQALVESPVGENTSFAVAARRSNIDLFFKAVTGDAPFGVVAAPVYWDYQAILAHRFNEAHKLRVLFFGSSDKFELQFDESAADDPALRGAAGGSVGFNRAQLEMESRLSDRVEQKLMVSVGPFNGTQRLGALEAEFDWIDINARADWSIFAAPSLRIDTGLDFQAFIGKGTYRGPAPSQGEGNPSNDSLASEKLLTIKDNIAAVFPAAFFEASWSPIEEVLLVPGVRVDYTAAGDDVSVDPRLGGRFQVAENTTLKSGVGLYSQPPEYYEVMEELGNPEVNPYRTLQTSFGVEQSFGESFRVDLDGFYKRWEDRIVGTENGVAPGFENMGTGRAYGMEVLLNMKLTPKTQAFAAYTLSRSERQDRDDDWRLFDSDQTHNLSFTANYDFGSGWLAGFRFRYVTGNPFTSVKASVYDATTDTYRGVYDGVNTERNSAFHQLDVRVEKLWKLGPVGLTTYLEAMNVYNAKNVEGTSYSFDFKETQGISGLPIFPNLGIRGEL